MREELESQSANGIKLYLNSVAVLITYICSQPELLFERRKLIILVIWEKLFISYLFINQSYYLRKKREKNWLFSNVCGDELVI